MVALDMYGIKTTLGGLLPYVRIPYTVAQVQAQMGAAKGGLFNFDNPVSYTLISGQMLHDFRALWKEGCSGGNAGGYLGTIAGVHRLKRLDAGVDTMTMTISPGSINYVEDNSGYFTLRQTGTFTDNVSGQWTWGSSNYPVGVAPIPGVGTKVTTTGRPASPLMHVLTTDHKLMQVGFFIDINGYGWIWLQLDEFGTTPLGNVDPEAVYETQFIKTLSTEGETDPMARYNPRIGTSTVGAYKLNKEGVREFLTDLWTTTTIESIRAQFIGDGSNAILGLQWFYGLSDKVTTTTTQSKINVGNVSFDNIASFPVISSEFVEFDFGALVVPRLHGDYLDYSAVSYRAYLPFVGMIDLDPRDIVGKTLYLKYRINMTDGSAVCQLSSDSSSPDTSGLLFSGSCQWGYDIPIRVDPGRSGVLAALRVVSSMVPVPGLDGGQQPYSSGSLAPNTSVSGDFEAKLIMYKRGEITNKTALAEAVGKPSASTFNVSDATGYLKADVVYNATSLPTRHAGDIVRLLQEGVYI